MKLRELEEYMKEPSIPKNCSPVAYWSIKRKGWPTLAKLAMKYCIVPASSVYSERLFSEFGNVYDQRRSKLRPDASEQVCMLHHNLPRFHNNGRKPQVNVTVSEEFEANVVEIDDDDEEEDADDDGGAAE